MSAKKGQLETIDVALQELRAEVSSLRAEIRRFSDSLISSRIESVERAMALDHLRLYAEQAEGILDERVERGLRQACSRRPNCEALFKKTVKQVLRACREEEPAAAVFAKLDEALNRVEDALKNLAGTPCESCYTALQKLLRKQRDNIQRIAGLEPVISERQPDLTIEVHRIVEDVLKPLSHPARLTILTSVYRGREDFSTLSQKTGMRGGHLIFHLRPLIRAGLMVQDGKKGDYIITPRGVEIINKLRSL